MEEDDQGFGVALSAQPLRSQARRVSLTPFSPSVSPSPRRLSSNFSRPNQPIRAVRQLSLVSLQGRFAHAEEATSARNVGGWLCSEEAVAWELFSPIHRILIVAVVAVAASKSKKNKEIFQLRKSVELRDQLLLSMQQKLDSLCDQVNYIRDQPQAWVDMSVARNAEFLFNESYGFDKAKSADHYWRRTLSPGLPPANDAMDNLSVRTTCGDEMLKYKMSFANGEDQEERRMSDMSDWASSVTSAADIQFNTLSMEQDIYNLKMECEQKDAKIGELTSLLHSAETDHRKRVGELEDIIRSKNTRIAKLKKDMLILEQKVLNLTRLRRPSFSASVTNTRQLPVMQDNLVYDMDSTTSPSSSDSDGSPKNPTQCSINDQVDVHVQSSCSSLRIIMDKPEEEETPNSWVNQTDRQQMSRPTSSSSEKSTYQKLHASRSLRPAQSSSAAGDSKSRRRPQTAHKASTSQKRWV